MNPKVDAFLEKASKWQAELKKLRQICLDCSLQEELKWGTPCYVYQKKNLIMIGSFKEYCIISYLQGAILKDTEKLLHKQGENTQASRTIQFTSVKEITNLEPTIKAYIFESIENEKAGLKVELKKPSELELVVELVEIMDVNPEFKVAFEGLTPGKKRGYNLYFAGAKQAKTRISRIERYMPKIFAGKGFHDCTCGHSKRMPTCDGSHKYL